MSAIDQIRYSSEDENLSHEEKIDAAVQAINEDENELVYIVDQVYGVLADREIIRAYIDQDWCEIGRIIDGYIEELVIEEARNIFGDE
jgi:hypothetical protein